MTQFGPAVLGQKEYDRQVKEAAKTGGGQFGPAVIGDAAGNRPAAVPDPNKPKDLTSLSVADLKQFIAADPGLVAEIPQAEIDRPDGPRKSALTQLRYAERKKAAPDEGTVDRIVAHIEKLDGAE